MSMRELRPLPHVELGPRGHYLLPPIVQVVGVAKSLGTEPTRMHVRLATGHELDIPVIPDAIVSLAKHLTVYLSDDDLREMLRTGPKKPKDQP